MEYTLCRQCGHQWIARKDIVRCCPACASKKWQYLHPQFDRALRVIAPSLCASCLTTLAKRFPDLGTYASLPQPVHSPA